jgi:hypothetical protein
LRVVRLTTRKPAFLWGGLPGEEWNFSRELQAAVAAAPDPDTTPGPQT